jgi:hypothetical protein
MANLEPTSWSFSRAHITEETKQNSSKVTNGVYSLVDIQANPQSVLKQNCIEDVLQEYIGLIYS